MIPQSEYQFTAISLTAHHCTSWNRLKMHGLNDLSALRIQQSHKTKSRAVSNVLLSHSKVIKEDLCRGSALRAGADGQMTPFYHFMSELPLSSPDQSFKSVNVSKFKARAAYMWLTCAQGEHLHVFELQRGVGWVQSLAVVCHVHVYR